MFGYLAMKETLESHKRHYDAARAQIRANHGLQKEALPKPKSAPACSVTTKGSAPVLATASRVRKTQQADESGEVPQEELSKLRNVARNNRVPAKKPAWNQAVPKAGTGPGGAGAGKKPIKKPTASEKVRAHQRREGWGEGYGYDGVRPMFGEQPLTRGPSRPAGAGAHRARAVV